MFFYFFHTGTATATATVTAKPPIDHRTSVSVTTNSDSAPLIVRRPLPLDTSLERKNFDLEAALKKNNVTFFLSELAPPGEEVKNIIDYLEERFEEKKKRLEKDNYLVRIVYAICLEGTEPLEERILYQGSVQRKTLANKQWVDIAKGRMRDHLDSLRQKNKGFTFREKSYNEKYSYILEQMEKTKRYLHFHILRIDSMDVIGVEGIIYHVRTPRMINKESRLDDIYANINNKEILADYIRASFNEKPVALPHRITPLQKKGKCTLCKHTNIFKNYKSFSTHIGKKHPDKCVKRKVGNTRPYEKWFDTTSF